MMAAFVHRLRDNRWLPWLLAAMFLTWMVMQTVHYLQAGWSFTTDDAYITLRYARHLSEGHGIVWNVGESPPVEGYSNFVFVWIGAVALNLHLDPVLVLKLLGAVSLLGSVLVSWWIARTWLGPVASLLPGFFLVSYQGALFWATSGLETAFFQLVVLATIATFIRAMGFRGAPSGTSPPAPAAAGQAERAAVTGIELKWLGVSSLLATLTCLTRPDGVVVALVLAVALTIRARLRLRPWLVVGFLFVLPTASYHVWRLVYFHALLPHSVVCKANYHGDPAVLTRDYWNMAGPYALLALVFSWRRLDVRHVVVWLLPLAYAIILFGADPIIGYWNRHTLAAFSVLLVPSAVGLANIAGMIWSPVARRWREIALVVGVLFVSLLTSRDFAGSLHADAAHYARRMEQRAKLGTWLDEHTSPEDWLVIGDAGLVPYETHANVMDAFCLNCLAMTEPPVSHSGKRFASEVFERRPRFIVVHSTRADRLVPRGEYGVYPAIVHDPRFRRQYVRVAKFGAQRDNFHYWVFRRRDAPPSSPPVSP